MSRSESDVARRPGGTLPLPARRARLGFRAAYDSSEFARITRGLIPADMDDKWSIVYEEPWLYAHRSWTGACIYAVRFQPSPTGASVVESWVNRDIRQYSEVLVAYDRALLTFLIDAFLLGRDAVFPVPTDLPEDVSALFQHSMVGRAYPDVAFPYPASARLKRWLRDAFEQLKSWIRARKHGEPTGTPELSAAGNAAPSAKIPSVPAKPVAMAGGELPSASWERIADHPRGPLIALRFGGVYPPGSAGNEFGGAMIDFLRGALTETNAAGVLIDLTAVDYVWGDTICGLAMPLLDEKKRFRPAAFVAVGRTASSLEPLLEPNFLPGIAGMKLFQTTDEALAHLRGSLDERRAAD